MNLHLPVCRTGKIGIGDNQHEKNNHMAFNYLSFLFLSLIGVS